MVNTVHASDMAKRKKLEGRGNELLSRAIAIYIAVLLICYILYMIAPIITFISKSFLYSFQTYLGLTGGLLILCDIFITRCIFKSRLWYLLVILCAILGISALKMREYGLKDNIFDLALLTIEMTLVYSFSTILSRDVIKRILGWWYSIALLIWTTACSISVFQFIFQIGYKYIADPNSNNPEMTRQGFLQSRLFGLFTGLDYAVYISWFLILISLYYLMNSKIKYERVLLILSTIILLSHIILSGSRSVMVSIMICSFFIPFFLHRNKEIKAGRKGYLKRIVVSLLVSLIVFVGVGVSKIGLSQLPHLAGGYVPHDDILSREELEESKFSSNNRFEIWKSYVSLYNEYGLFGLSLSNYNDYIAEKHPDSYLVKYFSDINNKSQKTDLVYESHNNYIFVLIGSGYLGLVCFLLFLIISIIKVIKKVLEGDQLPIYYIVCMAIVGSGCVQAMFMNSVFLKINAVSFLFWAAFGIMNNRELLTKN